MKKYQTKKKAFPNGKNEMHFERQNYFNYFISSLIAVQYINARILSIMKKKTRNANHNAFHVDYKKNMNEWRIIIRSACSFGIFHQMDR